MKIRLLIIIFIGGMLSCSTTKTSTIVSHSYDQSTNTTILTLLPYGGIKIPGNWRKTSYNEISRQHFFENEEGVSIAVTKNLQKKFPFYSSGISPHDFALKFFEWERDFYQKQGYTIKKIKTESDYVIWSATGKDANSVFLYGAKDKFAYNFAVLNNAWNRIRIIEFLIELFENN